MRQVFTRPTKTSLFFEVKLNVGKQVASQSRKGRIDKTLKFLLIVDDKDFSY